MTTRVPARRPAPRVPTRPATTGRVTNFDRAVQESDPIRKLLAVRDWAGTAVVGRDDLTKAVVLTIVSGLNCLFLGPPGTAKTKLVRLVSAAFADKDGDVFSILLTKFTKPMEVFGPPSMTALGNDQVRFNTQGFLPSARVAVVDEMFKGSSAIMNAMLEACNERTFKNGPVHETTPLRMVVGMSNEFPEDPAALAAYFDRFPVKLMVGYLDKAPFRQMLSVVASGLDAGPAPAKLTDADFAEIDRRVRECSVSDEIVDVLCELRATLEAKAVRVSDRRWAQAVRLLKAQAVIAGRSEVARDDLRVLGMVLWNTTQEASVLAGVLPDFLAPFERELKVLIDEAYSHRGLVLKAANLHKEDPNRPSPDARSATECAAKAIAAVRSIRSKVDILAAGQGDLTDSQKSLMKQASESLQAINLIIISIAAGRDKFAELLATEAQDVR